MHYIILGAGVIGLTSAYHLQKQGHQVTIIERNRDVAMECSYANGGQLSYGHVVPLTTPEALRYFFTHSHAVKLRHWHSLRFWKWAKEFAKNCTEDYVKATTPKLAELTSNSKAAMAEIIAETGIEFNHQKHGTLHLFGNEALFHKTKKRSHYQDIFPFDSYESQDEIIATEPALSQTKRHFAGGLYFPEDESGDIHQFCRGLAGYLQQEGAVFHYDTPIKEVTYQDNHITGLHSSGQAFSADHYLITLGAYATSLLKKIGIEVPIYPVKGYSITVPVKGLDQIPTHPIIDHDNKIVISRLGDQLRLAGLAEFAGFNTSIRKSCVASLKKICTELFPTTKTTIDQATGWACLRPCTTSGLPITELSTFDNMTINLGHGHLGWTLAAGSHHHEIC